MRSVRMELGGVRPAPQGSKRPIPLKSHGMFTGRVNLVEQSKLVKPYREALIHAIRNLNAEPFEGPVQVQVWFYFQRPKKPTHTYPKANGDLDKLQRAVGDALTMGGLLLDDSQIVLWTASKMYADEYHTILRVTDAYRPES